MSNITPPIIRRLDDLGRIVIPKAFRNQLKTVSGTAFEITLNSNNELILKKIQEPEYIIRPTEFGEEELVHNITGRVILAKPKITPTDIANLVGIDLAVEQGK